MTFRWPVLGIALAALVAVAGCSKKDPAISQLGGSEPQRISFGDPLSVQTDFAQKMNVCWFNGTTPVLRGYRYDTVPPSEGAPASRIRIYPEQAYGSQGGGGFEVEFHPYNDNTLISTRNVSLPTDLAARLKRDIETWIFGRNDCGDYQA